MASVFREFIVKAPADRVWNVVGDFAGGSLKLAPEVFVGCKMLDATTRELTFADGMKAKEQLISRDDMARRGVWRWVDESVEHDNTVMQVFPEGNDTSRVVWVHDVLPDAAAEWLAPTMDALIPVFQESLET